MCNYIHSSHCLGNYFGFARVLASALAALHHGGTDMPQAGRRVTRTRQCDSSLHAGAKHPVSAYICLGFWVSRRRGLQLLLQRSGQSAVPAAGRTQPR